MLARLAQAAGRAGPETAARPAPRIRPRRNGCTAAGPRHSGNGSAELFEHRHLFVRHHLDARNGELASPAARGQAASCAPCVRSWTRSTACSTAAAARTRRWRSWRGCASGCGVTGAWGRCLDKLTFAQPGEGADLPGRQAAAGDLQRGRTGQPAPPQDAEDDLPRTNQANPGGRLALDLQRDQQASGRGGTLTSLHRTRQ